MQRIASWTVCFLALAIEKRGAEKLDLLDTFQLRGSQRPIISAFARGGGNSILHAECTCCRRLASVIWSRSRQGQSSRRTGRLRPSYRGSLRGASKSRLDALAGSHKL